MATLTNLAKALEKVGDYCTFDDLPSDRIDNLWDKLAVDCNLTFPELSALKKSPMFWAFTRYRVYLY